MQSLLTEATARLQAELGVQQTVKSSGQLSSLPRHVAGARPQA